MHLGLGHSIAHSRSGGIRLPVPISVFAQDLGGGIGSVNWTNPTPVPYGIRVIASLDGVPTINELKSPGSNNKLLSGSGAWTGTVANESQSGAYRSSSAVPWSVTVAAVSNQIITESGDNIISESGDNLVTE